jgi:LuxR family maltose regulon positive regulatory protein
MAIPILKTKLYIPPPPPELVSRPRLLNQLDEGLNRKLTLISAPAGFGKTTLITEWLVSKNKGEGRGVAWLSLGESDNDPLRFWAYVVAALNTLQENIGQSALDLLFSPQPSTFETFLTLLINDLVDLPAKSILVLDDYHVVENEQIHNDLTFLLENLPAQLHLVITTRTDPPLPLARLRARNQLGEFRADDLRFTPDEATLFFNDIKALGLSSSAITMLEARIEGWIVGLQLAALSIEGHPDKDSYIANFAGSHQYILDYLAQEVFEQQPEDVQNFMLQTAILNRLTAPLCDAVTGRDDSQMMLELLARRNLFVMPLDEQRLWYRYHNLFADLLRYHLPQTPIDVEILHKRAAGWYEHEGFLEETVKHTLAIKDYDQFEQIILNNIMEILRQGKSALLLKWLDAMPDSWYDTRPMFGLAKAWVLLLNGKIDACKACVQTIEPYFTDVDVDLVKQVDESFDAQQIQNVFMGLQAQIDLYNGEFTQAIQKINNVLETLSDNMPFGIGLRGLLTQYLGLAYWLIGDVEATDQAIDRAKTASSLSREPAAMLTANNLADLYRIRGQRTQAAALYQHVLQMVDENMDPPFFLAVRVAHVELGHLLYEWNDLDAAEYHFKEALKLSQKGFIDLRVVGLGYYGLFILSHARQDVEGMVSAGQKLMQLAQDVTSSPLAVFKVIKIPLQIAQGDLDTLRHEIHRYELMLENEFNTVMAMGHLVIAEAYLALQEPTKAITLLSRLIQDSHVPQELGLQIQCRVLLAVTYQIQGDLPEALTELKQALLLAEPENYIRSFVDNGPRMAKLLQKYLADPTLYTVEPAPSPDYVRKLLAAFDIDMLSTATDTSNQSLVDPLTERELEVLSLIASDLSNQEIADTLIISKNTLKTHIKNIYDKLDAHSRLQAVTKAQELNLL